MAYRDLTAAADMPPVYREWLYNLKNLQGKQDHTVRAYGQSLRRLLSYSELEPSEFSAAFPDRRTDDQDLHDTLRRQYRLTDIVRDMQADCNHNKTSRKTISQALAALKSFYDFCLDDGLIRDVPDIKRLRKAMKLDFVMEMADPEYYRPSEIWDLYQAAATEPDAGDRVRWRSRDLAMSAFLAVLGLRSSELIDADIDWLTQERLIDTDDRAQWMLRVQGKGGRYRYLPISIEILRVNEEWQQERSERFGRPRGSDPLFVANDGKRFNYQRLLYWLRRLNREAGLRDRSLHSLRHTAGVQLAAQGVPMNVIQSLLGHASIATTGIYTELAGGQLVGFLERTDANTLLGEALAGSATGNDR